jgi:hypothetical protein
MLVLQSRIFRAASAVPHPDGSARKTAPASTGLLEQDSNDLRT